ncbi:hypothetical protein V8C44DRAFT_191714 [Trichoderma aethiopicum]
MARRGAQRETLRLFLLSPRANDKKSPERLGREAGQLPVFPVFWFVTPRSMRSMRYSGCGAGEREIVSTHQKEIAGPRFYESGALLEGNNLQAGAVSTRVMPASPSC